MNLQQQNQQNNKQLCGLGENIPHPQSYKTQTYLVIVSLSRSEMYFSFYSLKINVSSQRGLINCGIKSGLNR